jgi:curved DNA-binding protein CbpA
VSVSDELRSAYEALELEPGAGFEEVQNAYRDLVKVWHPDRYAHESDRLKARAEEKLKAINEAYEKLRAVRHNLPAGQAKPAVAALTPLDFGGRWGYVDDTGAPVIYPEFVAARAFREGLAAVKLIEKWGYINATGDYTIAPLYEECLDFQEGLAAVKWYGRWGYIDKAGRFVIQPRYQEARSFQGDTAEVRLGARWGTVTRDGQASFTLSHPGRQMGS